MTERPTGTRERSLPEHVTTPLLTLITQQALEEDYRSVAERRSLRPGAEPPRTRLLAIAALLVLGVLVGVAAVQNSRNEAVDDAGRATLIAQIEQARDELSDTQAAIADTTRDNRALTEGLTGLTATRQTTTSRLRRLQVSTGYYPVTGEGVRIVVDDPPDAGEIEKVRDADLAKLVNGLWEAGAEAIAINDQRLNPLGAIRNVSIAIHVNTVPQSPPYVVRAIGDSRTLQADLAATTHGAEFFALAQQLGFVLDVDNVEELSLPAARQRRLQHVQTGTAEQRAGGGVEEGQP
jgi:uncharacterized protein YlxW (UPF0749 family)